MYVYVSTTCVLSENYSIVQKRRSKAIIYNKVKKEPSLFCWWCAHVKSNTKECQSAIRNSIYQVQKYMDIALHLILYPAVKVHFLHFCTFWLEIGKEVHCNRYSISIACVWYVKERYAENFFVFFLFTLLNIIRILLFILQLLWWWKISISKTNIL